MLRRLPINHPTCLEIENKIRAIEAGYAGESYVDNFLKQVNFPKHYAILKDLHIPISPHNYLQVDTLILTRKYIAVLEIKKYTGQIVVPKKSRPVNSCS
ncbi:nuclease-related domain-containing protein [Bacillus sp. FJAT-22090]|uniref:nuclease-related domain-containing protein n=1 Tax=Bacillus sp. FJAT-22090 TaxID=1581038 RepID=UPI001E36FA3C|nr:nuclease-related domain-containing protein [Bacillus sp. FJAT-22090]